MVLTRVSPLGEFIFFPSFVLFCVCVSEAINCVDFFFVVVYVCAIFILFFLSFFM